MKKKIVVTLLILSCFFLPFFLKKRTHGFCLEKISSSHPYDKRWETRVLTPEEKKSIESILSQNFTFLGSGNHCYAFLSEDKKHVIKFFKQKKMSLSSWMNFLPLPDLFLPRRVKLIKSRIARREKEFTSYKIAFEEIQKETAVIYLHLNKTFLFQKKLTLIDQHGKRHCFDIDQFEFLIQKKADLFYDAIINMVNKGEIQKSKKCFIELFRLIEKRCQRGLFDDDLMFHKNFGIIDGNPIEIDVGEFIHDERWKNPEMYKPQLSNLAQEVRHWLFEHCPLLLKEMEEFLNQFTGSK